MEEVGEEEVAEAEEAVEEAAEDKATLEAGPVLRATLQAEVVPTTHLASKAINMVSAVMKHREERASDVSLRVRLFSDSGPA